MASTITHLSCFLHVYLLNSYLFLPQYQHLKNLVLHIQSYFTARLREIEFSAQTSEGTNEGKSATSNWFLVLKIRAGVHCYMARISLSWNHLWNWFEIYVVFPLQFALTFEHTFSSTQATPVPVPSLFVSSIMRFNTWIKYKGKNSPLKNQIVDQEWKLHVYLNFQGIRKTW